MNEHDSSFVLPPRLFEEVQSIRQGEIELAALQLYSLVRDHKPVGCHACMGTFLHWDKRLKELGVAEK